MNDPITLPRESYAFAVWRKGKPMPHQREQSLEAARQEADRQARCKPGARFVIFQEIERVHLPKTDHAPAALRGDCGGVPKAPDAKREGCGHLTNVNDGRAPVEGPLDRLNTVESGERRNQSHSSAAPRQAEEPGGCLPPRSSGSEHSTDGGRS